MHFDFTRPPGALDPLEAMNPAAPWNWVDWMCAACGEEGDEAALDGGQCPQCGADVEDV